VLTGCENENDIAERRGKSQESSVSLRLALTLTPSAECHLIPPTTDPKS
jgi:hypothetical protein